MSGSWEGLRVHGFFRQRRDRSRRSPSRVLALGLVVDGGGHEVREAGADGGDGVEGIARRVQLRTALQRRELAGAEEARVPIVRPAADVADGAAPARLDMLDLVAGQA